MLDKIIAIAREAGKIQLNYYRQKIDVQHKEDQTPVTIVDLETDVFIRNSLHLLFPSDKILTEETEKSFDDFTGRVWMVDPLDGTKAFLAHDDGFCIIIGLCVNGKPELGVVYCPASDKLYYAQKGKGAYYECHGKKQKISVTTSASLSGAVMIVNKYKETASGLHPLITDLEAGRRTPSHSIGIIICQIAAGEADFYICAHKAAGKWDTCGPQVILEEARGRITDQHGKELDYTQDASKWQFSFLPTNNYLHREVLQKLQEYL